MQWKLTGIQKQGDGTYSLSYDTPDGGKTLRARSVALTVPAYVAADLLQQQVGLYAAPQTNPPCRLLSRGSLGGPHCCAHALNNTAAAVSPS